MKRVGNHIRSQENYFRRSLSLISLSFIAQEAAAVAAPVRPQLLLLLVECC
jgi:hypothetical protein